MTDTEWSLTLAEDPSEFIVLNPTKGERPPTLGFEDGEVRIFTGCNKGTGPATLGGPAKFPRVAFGSIVYTQKSCPGNSGQIERAMLEVLNEDSQFNFDDGSLHAFSEATDYDLQFLPADPSDDLIPTDS
ncbi:MAG: META domain-containing protein [Solirubrobacterales bacterium]|nr:META domain-containing protein [Solirubrobacterales bacterium]